jgi:hypothetical protein
MQEIKLGDVKDRLSRIKLELDALVDVLNHLDQNNPIGEGGKFTCPPIIHPLGPECELKFYGLDGLPITVADANRSVQSIANWTGDILTVMKSMNQNIVLPPRV